MKTPAHWRRRGALAWLLLPLAAVVRLAALLLAGSRSPVKVPAPVICVGNAVAGGAGKTPVALAVAQLLQEAGRRPAFVSRGYGGRRQTVPLQVDRTRHSAAEVGDEPLLLAAMAPCFVCVDRAAAARAAIASGADTVIMDDGLQNSSLRQDVRLLVIDGEYGLGNGFSLPAGPLRESLSSALAHSDAVVLIGEDAQELAPRLGRKHPLWRAALQPGVSLEKYRNKPVVAFAGIGRPEKFFAMLQRHGLTLTESVAFPDHHPYTAQDCAKLAALKAQHGAKLLTTEKDAVRLPQAFRGKAAAIPARLQWQDAEGFACWLRERVNGAA